MALAKDHPDAVALWALAHSWVDDQQTDGFVPEQAAHVVTGWNKAKERRAAQALVRVGLWEETDGGWTFHDWAEHNVTRAERADEAVAA
jgi:hypothetical protein